MQTKSTNSKEQKDIKKAKIVFAVFMMMIILAEFSFLWIVYHVNSKEEKQEALIVGEAIIGAIKTELAKCEGTTELLEDLYVAYQDIFCETFEITCEELLKDDLAIGSLYFAPDGIIKYAYPENVTEATSNFEVLKDPIQGPKAQLAVNTGRTTIAGPHDLLEGGTGFIIRNPIYMDETCKEFEGFTIMVLDTDIFLSNVEEKLSDREKKYNFAVYKEPDSTAVVDENGFIFYKGSITSRDIEISFEAPNDTWYLVIEPKGGFNPWKGMGGKVFFSLLVAIALIVGLHHGLGTIIKSNENLYYIGNIDELTGLLNRHALENKSDCLETGSELSVIFGDIMGLKKINDTQGHKAGDTLLKKTAEVCVEVFGSQCVYRYGGDEFVILLEGKTKTHTEKLLAELEKKHAGQGIEMAVGYSYTESYQDNYREMQRQADENMYEDKKARYERKRES